MLYMGFSESIYLVGRRYARVQLKTQPRGKSELEGNLLRGGWGVCVDKVDISGDIS